MSVNDIRIEKKLMREHFKHLRASVPDKEAKDLKIRNKLSNLWAYRDARTVFTYVSMGTEVSTIEIIEMALKGSKKVAVPYCIPDTRDMRFYYISSLEDLQPGSFGVLEPRTDKCEAVREHSGICLVPGLAFDRTGRRLGYGKGYYDRFLSNFNGCTVGLTYQSCIADELPSGRYDVKVDVVIHDGGFFTADSR